MNKITDADFTGLEERVLAHMKADADRMQRIRNLVNAVPANASNAQKARALDRIREIAGPGFATKVRTGRVNEAERPL